MKYYTTILFVITICFYSQSQSDGYHCVDAEYYNSKTGQEFWYRVSAIVENGTLAQLNLPNGRHLDYMDFGKVIVSNNEASATIEGTVLYNLKFLEGEEKCFDVSSSEKHQRKVTANESKYFNDPIVEIDDIQLQRLSLLECGMNFIRLADQIELQREFCCKGLFFKFYQNSLTTNSIGNLDEIYSLPLNKTQSNTSNQTFVYDFETGSQLLLILRDKYIIIYLGSKVDGVLKVYIRDIYTKNEAYGLADMLVESGKLCDLYD